ncbi:MAG: hypothetical protein EOP82_14645 [Variovorax sp.]|nr:MAG: hypothetical protein EOP82_14645 [Variovorax sp.]
MFADAPPLERATLKVVAFTIEVERERLRPELGKARRSARGFAPASMDGVDTMSWETLLQRPAVMERCAIDTKTKASEILRMVLDHCRPSNPDAIFWMRSFYSLAERMHADMLNMARVLVNEHERYLSSKAKAKRTANSSKGGKSRTNIAIAKEKRTEIQQIWASGKYMTKGECAEQESAALGMPLSSAIKALNGIKKESPA